MAITVRTSVTDPLATKVVIPCANGVYDKARAFFDELSASTLGIKTPEGQAPQGLMTFAEKEAQILQAITTFENGLTKYGDELQAGTVKDVNLDALRQEKERVLHTHWDEFMGAYFRVKEFGFRLQRIIDFLTPPTRQPADEKTFREFAPEMHAQMKEIDSRVATRILTPLQEKSRLLKGLQDKLWTQLNAHAYKMSIQRFCQIVDNNGRPLGTWTLSTNRLTTPVIPQLPAKKPTPPAEHDPSEEEEFLPSPVAAPPANAWWQFGALTWRGPMRPADAETSF